MAPRPAIAAYWILYGVVAVVILVGYYDADAARATGRGGCYTQFGCVTDRVSKAGRIMQLAPSVLPSVSTLTLKPGDL